MTPEELEAVLERLGRKDGWPPTPPLAASVRERVEHGTQPVTGTRAPRVPRRAWRPAVTAAGVTVLVLAVTLSLSVTARRAVADLLGIVGVRISFGDDEVSPTPLRAISLGEPVSRERAGELAGFEVAVPSHPGEAPSFHYDPDVGVDGMVSLAYPRSATHLSEVDLLVTQFAADVDEVYLDKQATAGTRVFEVDVGSERGYWISGTPHVLYKVDPAGRVRSDSVRLAGQVLLWEEDGITYRIEGAPSLKESLRIAVSIG